jgi:FtsP/CotA-like multicopper oxidase with cupredoxin domain
VPARSVDESTQQPLPGGSIPKYVDPLPVFGNHRISGGSITVSAKEFRQQVLPASVYSQLGSPDGTVVWGYQVGEASPNYPGFSIEATRGKPIEVTYRNELPLPPDLQLQSYLSVDQTIHWADPLHEMGSRKPYIGPPPIVSHLHGGEVESAFDGHPEAWFTPGLALRGPGYVANVYEYPNGQEATALWFHDHALGMTRLNVYSGLAAFYLIRDAYDTGKPGKGLDLPAGERAGAKIPH